MKPILKHGSISVANIKDKATRDVLMKLNENIVGLAGQLEAAQREIETLKRRLKEGA